MKQRLIRKLANDESKGFEELLEFKRNKRKHSNNKKCEIFEWQINLVSETRKTLNGHKSIKRKYNKKC